MRCMLFLVLTSLFITPNFARAADAGAHERSFIRALELFDAAKTPGDYRAAARQLETIVSDGVQSGAVFYNLGNAYYRAGEFGRAILNYRKAKPYRPQDPYLIANLQQALAVAPGRLSESPRPLWTHILFWTDWVSFPGKVRLASYSLILAAILTLIAVVIRRPRLNWVSAGLVVVGLGLCIDLALTASDVNGSKLAVITGETTARKGTGQSYEPAFDQPLKDGAEFQVLNETPDWTFGHFEGIGDGWVRNEFVAR